MTLDPRVVARALGGDLCGRNNIIAPGPSHSPADRSLAVKLNPTAPDGFLVYSHAGDDWRECRDHVRRRLGLPAWEQATNNAVTFQRTMSPSGTWRR
jgi:hypothetical protein